MKYTQDKLDRLAVISPIEYTIETPSGRDVDPSKTIGYYTNNFASWAIVTRPDGTLGRFNVHPRLLVASGLARLCSTRI